MMELLKKEKRLGYKKTLFYSRMAKLPNDLSRLWGLKPHTFEGISHSPPPTQMLRGTV